MKVKGNEPKIEREHPEDKAARLDAECKAKKHGPALIAARLDDLKTLLMVYADCEAEAKLQELREWFWDEVIAKGEPA